MGVVYFRHGAKSEPCTSDDLVAFIKREVNAVKDFWMSGIRKVIEAPEGSQIMVIPANATPSQGNDVQGFRFTDDPNAPSVRVDEDDIFRNYPYYYKDLTEALKQRYKDFVENKQYHAIRKRLVVHPTSFDGCGRIRYPIWEPMLMNVQEVADAQKIHDRAYV